MTTGESSPTSPQDGATWLQRRPKKVARVRRTHAAPTWARVARTHLKSRWPRTSPPTRWPSSRAGVRRQALLVDPAARLAMFDRIGTAGFQRPS